MVDTPGARTGHPPVRSTNQTPLVDKPGARTGHPPVRSTNQMPLVDKPGARTGHPPVRSTNQMPLADKPGARTGHPPVRSTNQMPLVDKPGARTGHPPDIKQAEATLQIQITKYNLSVAELYPKIQFGGSIGFSAVDFSNFASNEPFTWSIFPNISWAAFNLGRVKQQINKEDALTLATLQQYEKTVLKALEEIRTAMTNYTNELERRETLRKSSLASAEAADIAQKRFNAGLDSFIDYLSADNTLLQAENRLAISEIASVTSLIAIYKSLGGGWEIISETEIDNKFETMKVANNQ
ncbi:TolC family protein [Aquimarina gracilis]|uniref:TolC family protein n=1 Tax=Aquimarina gracilis TaxID=874422 RepID=UPI002B46C17C|nr:TolC family protein [Aquimarina gracilis]